MLTVCCSHEAVSALVAPDINAITLSVLCGNAVSYFHIAF